MLGYVVESSRIQRRALEKGNRPSFDFASQFTQIGTGDGDRDAVSPIVEANQQNSQLITVHWDRQGHHHQAVLAIHGKISRRRSFLYLRIEYLDLIWTRLTVSRHGRWM